MNLDLRDKNVLITGGSKGVGLACAQIFRNEGARIGLVSRSRKNLNAARTLLGEAFTVAADVSDHIKAAAMVEYAEAQFGPIDILVNCAGAAQRTPADQLTPAIWRAAMDAKYFSYINVIDPVIKRMASRGRGTIVNVIGNGGKIPSPVHLAGGAANAALMLATAGLANAYAPRGVSVVGINPGPINTDRVVEGVKAEATHAGVSENEALDRLLKGVPLGRFAEPEEIAGIVAFAASPHGRFLSGANITADGAASPVVV
jgi:NAD(P)-dependent dehydrogenase (short-subunit alcohol dehydrogenase family)